MLGKHRTPPQLSLGDALGGGGGWLVALRRHAGGPAEPPWPVLVRLPLPSRPFDANEELFIMVDRYLMCTYAKHTCWRNLNMT